MHSFKLLSVILALLFIGCSGNADSENPSPRQKTTFNSGWKFVLADSTVNSLDKFHQTKIEWKNVTLPHDWSIKLPFDRNAAPGNDGGYLPGGTGWYVKKFDIDDTENGKRHQLYFEGVYENSEVYVNGNLAGGHPYGYNSFFVDLTPYLKRGENEVVVKADNSRQKNCRWYSGSGIYRNVWMITTSDVHIGNWGVNITTPTLNTVNIQTTLENESETPRDIQLNVTVEGARDSESITLQPGETRTIAQTLSIPDAKSWSPESPNLYQATITIEENGKTIDHLTQPFGFRTISYSADEGFKLNGKPILLNGGCVHHDNGILGAAAYDKAEYRKARLMEEAGFNAVRTSHNPSSEAFLNACDEIGLLVIDEAFDGWRDKKNDYDYHLLFDKWAETDVATMVLRDRNHPSVFCWSIGNEIIERKKPQAVNDAHTLATVCHTIDPTRPVTQALASWDADWEIYDSLAAAHDIVGYNYMIHKAEGDHKRVPQRVMMQTESYPRDAWSNYRMAEDHSYVIGDFVWTALDYIGESGIGRWYYEGDVEGEHYHRPLYPWHAAYCGDIDLTGLRKPISHYRSMLWNPDGEHLFIAVREPDGYNGKIKTTKWGTHPTFESWNWEGHEGKPIEVEVYSHYPSVRLYLNDKLIGESPVNEMKATFTVDYAPGTLRAEGINENKVAESVSLTTAGEVSGIRLTSDTSEIFSDGEDIAFITIELTDKDGNLVPTADNQCVITVEGGADLLALGNADIKDCDPYFDATHKAWKGRALAVVRSNGKKTPTKVKLSIPGENNFKSISETININSK